MSAMFINFGLFEDKVHKFPVKIFYNHTDAGGIVYYANYLRIAEEARVSLFEMLGKSDAVGYNEIKYYGDFVVRSCNVEYYKSARFGDDLEIHSSIIEVGKVYLVILQKIMRGDILLVEVQTKIVFIGIECGDGMAGCSLGSGGIVVGKPIRIPEFWMVKIKDII